MQPRVFERLHRVMQAARAAEEVRLVALLGRLNAGRRRLQDLRGRMLEGRAGPVPDAADLAAACRWRARLAAEIRAEHACAAELAAQVETMRASLGRALARESAVAELIRKARSRARREAARRADLASATSLPRGVEDRPGDYPELSSPSLSLALPVPVENP